MNVLADIQNTLATLDISIETGVFTEQAPSQYMVVVPMTDTYELHADNAPVLDVQEARISIFSQGNYLAVKRAVERRLLQEDFTITGRLYVGYDTETGYHHYAVDVAKHYEMEE